MTDLRAALIQAGADAPNPMFFGGNRESALMVAEDMLDAFLDTLAVRADEWWVEAAEGRAVDCRVEHWVVEPEGLIQILRGDE